MDAHVEVRAPSGIGPQAASIFCLRQGLSLTGSKWPMGVQVLLHLPLMWVLEIQTQTLSVYKASVYVLSPCLLFESPFFSTML